MSDIFISYASEDRDKIIPLVKALEEHKWSIFWDWKSIPVGKTWRQFIREGLNDSKCVLVLWSEKSIDSEWVIEEADHGKLNGILVPARIDDVRPPIGFGQIQAANLIMWTGDIVNPEFERLVHAIESILGPSSKHVREIKRTAIDDQRKGEENQRLEGDYKHAQVEQKTKVDKITAKKIGLLIALATVVFAGVILFIREELTRLKTEAPAVPIEPEKPITGISSGKSSLVKFTNSIGMEFVLIPAGSFNINKGRVEISQPYYIQKTEVTQGQWKKIMKTNPSNFIECGENCPVENISWEDAIEFIAKLNEFERTAKYRLPTEAEWYYACSANLPSLEPMGRVPNSLHQYAWFYDNSQKKTHVTGSKNPNPFGIFDMMGNVMEWCNDWYGDFPSPSLIDPNGPETGMNKALRGGSYLHKWNNTGCDFRFGGQPGLSDNFIGFRCVSAIE